MRDSAGFAPGFPSSVSYSVVRTIMRGLLVAFRNAGFVERGHVVECADGRLEQRECEHRTGSFTKAEVELQERAQAQAAEQRPVP